MTTSNPDQPVPPNPPPTPRRRGMMLRLLLYPIVLIGGAVGLLMLFENSLLYHPAKAEESWMPPTSQLEVEDVWFNLPDGTKLHAWYTTPQNPKWYVLYNHGNAGNLSYRQSQLSQFRNRIEAACLIYDYPGYGKSEGRPNEAVCHASGLAGYNYLIETKGIKPEQLLLLGESLGSGVATELAANQPHAATILVSPFTSIPDMAQLQFPYLPARWLCQTQFNNLKRVSHYEKPLFLIHGKEDRIVPFQHSEQLLAACPSSHKQLYPMENAGHNDGITPVVYEALKSFLAELRK